MEHILTVFLLMAESSDRLVVALVKNGYGVKPGFSDSICSPGTCSSVFCADLESDHEDSREVLKDVMRIMVEIDLPYYGVHVVSLAKNERGRVGHGRMPLNKKPKLPLNVIVLKKPN